MHLPFPGKERGALSRAVKRYLNLSSYPRDARAQVKMDFAHSVAEMDPALTQLIEEELENTMKG